MHSAPAEQYDNLKETRYLNIFLQISRPIAFQFQSVNHILQLESAQQAAKCTSRAVNAGVSDLQVYSSFVNKNRTCDKDGK